MTKKLFVFLFLLWFVSGCQAKAITPEVDPTFHILWIGDESLNTSRLDMQTAIMLSEDGLKEAPINMQMLTDTAYTLASGNMPTQVKKWISDHPVDLVILQAFSVGQVTEEGFFQTYGSDWINYFESQNLDMVIFYPWRQVYQDEGTYQNMVDQVLELAWAKDVTIVPLGDVWQLLSERNPQINLLATDLVHPNAAGVYLNGVVFYSVFTGKSAINHPVKLSIGFDQPDTIILLDEETLQAIQEVAWQVIQTYQSQGEFSVFHELTFAR
jgi:hypothetical protein